jgi:adenylate cyclase
MIPGPMSDAPGNSHTFVFADLAGFTALTEAHGDEQAADVVDDFCAAVRAILREHGAMEIKQLGDALMLRVDHPNEAVTLALRIVHEIGARHGFPTVRVRMHTGPAVERGGDWFGTTVNVAARVSGSAAGGEVLVTETTAAGLAEGRFELHARGRRHFKNVGDPVVVYSAVGHGRTSEEGLNVDPVCRMAVEPERAAGTLTYSGFEYRFCSLECAGAFARDPKRYMP